MTDITSDAAKLGKAHLSGLQNYHPPRHITVPLKRLTDITGALFLLLFFAPLMGFVALAIYLTGGNVFYAHARMGRHRKTFNCLKFRTMQMDADRALHDYLAANPEARREWEQYYKLKHDPRVTKLGRILRRTHLDELPQLWNILIGDMSLVGIRPVTEPELEYYGEHTSLYTSRRPGLTGLWQVSGQHQVDYEERILIDSWYASNWSYTLDLFILFKTVKVMANKLAAA